MITIFILFCFNFCFFFFVIVVVYLLMSSAVLFVPCCPLANKNVYNIARRHSLRWIKCVDSVKMSAVDVVTEGHPRFFNQLSTGLDVVCLAGEWLTATANTNMWATAYSQSSYLALFRKCNLEIFYLFHRLTRTAYLYNGCLPWYNVVLTSRIHSTIAWNTVNSHAQLRTRATAE